MTSLFKKQPIKESTNVRILDIFLIEANPLGRRCSRQCSPRLLTENFYQASLPALGRKRPARTCRGGCASSSGEKQLPEILYVYFISTVFCDYSRSAERYEKDKKSERDKCCVTPPLVVYRFSGFIKARRGWLKLARRSCKGGCR